MPIIGAVAGYSLLETALLLMYLLPEGPPFSWSWHGTLIFAQFLVIPGMAALFSLILYGRHEWKRRMAFRFIAVAGFVLLLCLIVVPLDLLARTLEERSIDLGGSKLFETVSLLWSIVILLTVPILLFLINRRATKRGVELESSRWLAEREAGLSADQRRSRNRAICRSLWIPSLLVVLIFLFLPEVWGLLTHAGQPRAGKLTGYEVTVPPTWIILYSGSSSPGGWSAVSGIAGRGIGLGVKQYLNFGDPPISNWGVGVAGSDEARRKLSHRGEPTARRDFQVGKAKLTCFEYRPLWGRPMRVDDGPLVLIECSSPDRLQATFVGEKIHVAAFYGMLASMTPGLPPEAK